MSNEGFGTQIPIQIPKLPTGLIRMVIAGVIVLILIFTSFYTIGPEQIGIVLRFGKFVRITDPGLNFQDSTWGRAGNESAGTATTEGGVRLPDRPRRNAHPVFTERPGR